MCAVTLLQMFNNILHGIILYYFYCIQDDVNVVVVDWSAGGNTWNYYKAAVNTRIVGYQISKCVHVNVN